MELEEGKIYTTQQMQKFMGISKSTWDHRRDELLENFCLYYEYEEKPEESSDETDIDVSQIPDSDPELPF